MKNKATHSDRNSKISPYDMPELYDLVYGSLDFDIPYWLEAAGQAEAPVLEAACGTGRVLLRLLEAGIDAEGIDASSPMIDRFRSKARPKGWADRAVVADMRDFSRTRRFGLIICPFNGFAHCESTDDQIRALRCFHRHLAPGGAAVLHMSYPGPHYWNEPDGIPFLETEAGDPGSGRTFQMWDTRAKDPVSQTQKSRIEIREINRSGRKVASHWSSTSQRWVYKFELELLFRAAGFERWSLFGGLDGRALDDPGDQILAWAWKG